MVKLLGRVQLLATALGIALLAGVCPAAAQFEQPIRFVVGTPTGGALDIYVRMITNHMHGAFKEPLIVENKPGANGNIGAQYAAQRPADGRTVWVGTAAMTEINPVVYRNLAWKMDDFVPLIRGIEAPLVLTVNATVPAKTLPEVIAWVKANPGKLGYASFSPGTPSSFLGYMMTKKFGLDLEHVPYAGSGPQLAAMLSGEVMLGFTQVAGTLAHMKAGRLRAIATTGPNRFRELPDVPTFAELGHADLSATIWFGLLVRSGTPKTEFDRLLAAAKAAHVDPDVRSRLEQQGFEVSGLTGPQLADDIRRETARWSQVVKETGFTVE